MRTTPSSAGWASHSSDITGDLWLVIKVRGGRFLADVNAPSVDEAERLARRVVEVMKASRGE
jgi:hypothetical protein